MSTASDAGPPSVSGRFAGDAGPVWSVAVSPDGTRIVGGGDDGTVRVWDLATGEPVGNPLIGHSGAVWSVAVSPDRTRVVSGGGDDGTVRVWDLATGDPVGDPLAGHIGGVRSVAVSPDGSRVVSGGDDGAVRVWTPFGPPRVDLGAGVVTDTATTADQLDLARDVQTLSALLAATSTAPPLSIALMGRWGSGKSSLMEQLIAAVEGLSAQNEPRGAYVRHVRQVRFNAWHYSDDHLWVGLVEQLFRELRGKPAPADAATESVPELQAKLGRVRTRQDRLDRRLADLEELDPGHGLFGQLSVIRRAVVAVHAAGQDAGAELRRRRFWWGLLFAVPAGARRRRRGAVRPAAARLGPDAAGDPRRRDRDALVRGRRRLPAGGGRGVGDAVVVRAHVRGRSAHQAPGESGRERPGAGAVGERPSRASIPPGGSMPCSSRSAPTTATPPTGACSGGSARICTGSTTSSPRRTTRRNDGASSSTSTTWTAARRTGSSRSCRRSTC